MTAKKSASNKDEHEKTSEEQEDAGVKIFTVRVPVNLVTLMDEAVDENIIIKRRNTWILNAINEQLKREGKL